MKKTEINIQPITAFTKRYENAVVSKSREIRLSIEEAGLLNAAMVNLLSNNIDEILKTIISSDNSVENQNQNQNENDVIAIKMDAGSFKK